MNDLPNSNNFLTNFEDRNLQNILSQSTQQSSVTPIQLNSVSGQPMFQQQSQFSPTLASEPPMHDFEKKYGHYSTPLASGTAGQPQKFQQQPIPSPNSNVVQANQFGGSGAQDQLNLLNQLLAQQAQSNSFLNMSGTQGSQQNQNLGPTQIYYQQQPQPQNPNQQQLLLLQLLQQQQVQMNQISTNSSNSSMFGQGFLGAQQLLAQNSQQPQGADAKPAKDILSQENPHLNSSWQPSQVQLGQHPQQVQSQQNDRSFHSYTSEHLKGKSVSSGHEIPAQNLDNTPQSPNKNSWLKGTDVSIEIGFSNRQDPGARLMDAQKEDTEQTEILWPTQMHVQSHLSPNESTGAQAMTEEEHQSIWLSRHQQIEQSSVQLSAFKTNKQMLDDERPLTGVLRSNSNEMLAPKNNNQPMSIEEQVIPALQAKASTFEELLEQQLDNFNGDADEQSQTVQIQKKQFLRRKSQPMPLGSQPIKKYKYYADAVKTKFNEGDKSVWSIAGVTPQERAKVLPNQRAANPSSMNRNQAASQPTQMTEFPESKSSIPFQRFGSQSNAVHNDEQEQPKPKKPFLKSGQGRNVMTVKRPTTARPQPRHQSPAAQQTHQMQQPVVQKERKNSMDEFEKLEKACNQETAKSSKAMQYNQKSQQKKLFDSDSDNEDHDQEYQPQEVDTLHDQRVQDSRSNIVKKMFYKEEKSTPQSLSQVQSESKSEQMSKQMQSLVDQKVAQLDRAMANYHAEHERLQKQKQEYEAQQRKLKVEQREFEAQKKRLLEDNDKAKDAEMRKLQQERRQLEQRQKNLQLANQASRKEREEIEALKREITRLTSDHEGKTQRQRKEVDRVKKLNVDLETKNQELNHEVKLLQQKLISAERTAQTAAQKKPSNESAANEPSRYSFSQHQANIMPVAERRDQSADSDEEEPPIDDDQTVEGEVEDNTFLEQQQESQRTFLGNQSQRKAQTEDDDYSLKFPPKYHSKAATNLKVVDQVVGHDGKIQRIYQSGKKEVIFTNGVKRETYPDGYMIVYFANEDVKQTFPDGKVVYYFADARTTQTTFMDGLQVFKFANQQIEKHFPDGTKEIIFPDGTIKCIFEDGEEESIFPDGTIQRIEKSGVKAIEFANGQKDILFPDGTRVREFPDGRVRKTYPDGRTETKNVQ